MTPMLGNLRRSPDRLAALASYARLIGWWAAPVNLWKLWRSRHYVTTFRGLREPAARLALRCPDWRVVDTYVLGTSYLAVGHLD